MNEQEFYKTLNEKGKKTGINPILLLSGIEGLYSFRNVPLNNINYDLLDSLIMTIFTLRIGDHFHALAQQKLSSSSAAERRAAKQELEIIPPHEIALSSNPYLKAFVEVLNGKGTIRYYHLKALEVAALEVKNVQTNFAVNNVGTLIMEVCENELKNTVQLSALFDQ
jgi:hypothetical protein